MVESHLQWNMRILLMIRRGCGIAKMEGGICKHYCDRNAEKFKQRLIARILPTVLYRYGFYSSPSIMNLNFDVYCQKKSVMAKQLDMRHLATQLIPKE